MQVADLSTDQLKALIRETVTQVLAEILHDSDQELVVRPEVEQQLLRSRQRRMSGMPGVSIEEGTRHQSVDLNAFSGVIQLEDDALEMQLQMRNEWI